MVEVANTRHADCQIVLNPRPCSFDLTYTYALKAPPTPKPTNTFMSFSVTQRVTMVKTAFSRKGAHYRPLFIADLNQTSSTQAKIHLKQVCILLFIFSVGNLSEKIIVSGRFQHGCPDTSSMKSTPLELTMVGIFPPE